MKKFGFIIMMILLTTSTIGCNDTTLQQEEIDVAKEKKILKFVSWSDGAQRSTDEKIINKFNAQSESIQVIPEFIPRENYLGRLNILIATEQSPDMGILHEYIVNDWGSQDRLRDLSDIENLDSYSKYSIQGNDGKVWGITPGLQTILLYYNKDIFDKYGIEYPSDDALQPWNWEEYLRAAQLLTRDINDRSSIDEGFDKNNIKTYGTIAPTETFVMLPLLYSNNASIATSDGMQLNLDTEQGRHVLQSIYDLLYKYNVTSTKIQEQSTLNPVYNLINGELAMFLEGQWRMADFAENNYDVGIAAIPYFDEPKNILWGAPIVLFRDCDYPEEAKEFISYFTDVKLSEEHFKYSSHMPNNIDWYEQGKLVDLWANNPSHNESFRKIAVDTVEELVVVPENLTLKNFARIERQIIKQELAKFFRGENNLENTLRIIEENTKPLFKGIW